MEKFLLQFQFFKKHNPAKGKPMVNLLTPLLPLLNPLFRAPKNQFLIIEVLDD
jgi:hypothetical protein